MTRRRRILLRVAGGVAAALLLVAGGGVLWVRSNTAFLGDAVASRLSSLTGRQVAIAGEFGLTASLTPTVSATGLSIANAPWGERPAMLTADRLEVELAVVPLLLDGEIRIDRVAVHGADAVIARGPGGALNWRIGPDGGGESGDGPRLRVGEAELVDSTILWRGAGEIRRFAIERLAWQAGDPDDGTARLVGRGRYGTGDADADEAPVDWTLEATLGAGAGGLRVDDLDARAASRAGTVVSITDGTIADLLGAGGLSLPLRVDADSLADAGALLGLDDLPSPGAMKAGGRLTGGIATLGIEDLSGRLGSADAPLLRVTGGGIGELLDGGRLDLRLEAEGESLAATGGRLGIDLPALGPYAVTGTLTGSFAEASLQDLEAVAGPRDAPRLSVTGGRTGQPFRGQGLDVPFEMDDQAVAAIATFLDLPLDAAALTSARIAGTLTGSLAAPGLQDLDGDLAIGDAAARFTGQAGNLLEQGGVDIRVDASAPDLRQLSLLTDSTLPATPPLRLGLRLISEDEALVAQDLRGSLGNTDIEGRLAVRAASRPPRLEGRLSAGRVDVDRLWPDAPAADGAPAAAAAEAATEAGTGGGLRPGWLDAVEAELALRADEVIVGNRGFYDARASLRLQDARLSVQDLTAKVAGGTVTADAALDGAEGDAEGTAAEVIVRFTASDIDVGSLIAGDDPGRERGEIDLDLNVNATGRTVDGLLSELDGQAAIFAENGRLEDVPLNLLVPDLDIARILPFVGRGDPTIRVNCLIGEFDVSDGVAQAETLLDTRRMTLLGDGTLNLQDRRIDFSLQPMAKSRKLSTAEVPVDIQGTLGDPQIRPRVGATIGGAVRGVLGGLLVPLNQLTALFGKEAGDACDQALERARARREAAAEALPPQ